MGAIFGLQGFVAAGAAMPLPSVYFQLECTTPSQEGGKRWGLNRWITPLFWRI
jgi:hypothetical protein